MNQRVFNSEAFGPTTFFNIDFGPGRGLIANKDSRYFLDGNFSILQVTSVKFGKEIQFQIWTQNSFIKEKRNNSKYKRIEMYFPLSKLNDLIKELEKIREAKE